MSGHTRKWQVTCIADSGLRDVMTLKADGPRDALRQAQCRRWAGLHAGRPRRTDGGQFVAVAYADADLSERKGEIIVAVAE